MFRWAARTGRDPEKVTRTSDATFYAPLKWKEPQIIFTCSLSDFFIEEADEWRKDAWYVIRNTPQHLWLILTKRSDRFHEQGLFDSLWPLENVRLGVSAENQRMLDKRARELFQIPAAGYFLSAEPLLGGLDLATYLEYSESCANCGDGAPFGQCCGEPLRVKNPSFDHVIVGGESGGPDYRSMVRVAEERLNQSNGKIMRRWVPKLDALARVRYIKAQCDAAGAKLYLKQWGGPRPESGGRQLDGKTYGDDPYEFWNWRKAA